METVLRGGFTSPAEEEAHRQAETTDSAASCSYASQRELKHVYVLYIYMYVCVCVCVCVCICIYIYKYMEAATDSKLMDMIVLIRLKNWLRHIWHKMAARI